MELKSLTYVFFVAVVCLLYFAVYRIRNAQKYVICLANTLFIVIAAGKESLLIILLITTLTYTMALLIEKQLNEKNKKGAQIIMWLSVLMSIVILCYFKFFKDTFEILRNVLQNHNISILPLITPIGLSYYTLSMIAYTVDVYHKKHEAEKNYIDFYTFITYFPSIIQGPVNLYKKIGTQIKENHKPEYDRIIKGLQRSLWGYFKKVVIADRIGIIVIGILQDESSAGFLLLWAMILYSFQIYTDFSGGIDVVMGISEILDIKLTENFRSPLVSKSITEYWNRWHMSLGEFMEKYIYYPIVLNRRVMKISKRIPSKYLQKVFSATIASIVVFVIVGIWHGTGWNYVVYGCYQALFVSSAVLLGPVYKRLIIVLHINEQAISWKIFRILRTFFLLVIGRYFIRAKDLTQALELFHKTFDDFKWSGIHILFDGSLYGYGLDYKNIYLMYACILLIITIDILHDKNMRFRELLMKQDIVFRFIIYFVALFGIIIFGIYGPGFSSASFIYQEF